MQHPIRLMIVVIGLLLFGLPSLAYADEATVQVDRLNVRSGPGLTYERIAQVKKAQRYDILQQQDDWLQINVNDRKGWIAKWLTKVDKETASDKRSPYRSKVDYLRVRSKPGLDSEIFGHLMRSDEVLASQQEGKWLKIDKYDGWVHADYMIKAEKDSKQPQKTNTKQTEPEKKTGHIKVNTKVLNVRNESNTNGKIVSQIKAGDIIKYISNQNKWYQVQLNDNRKGWVAGWLVDEVETAALPSNDDGKKDTPNKKQTTVDVIELSYNHTNLRNGPSTKNKVIGSGNKGETFQVIEKQGRWYKIEYKNSFAFVAGWIVKESTQQRNNTPIQVDGNLKGKTILIDAGHGGRDSGAVGSSGSHEKTHTLKTALALKKELENKGAKVLMARDTDEYVSLPIRSYFSNASDADVFLSLHYNSAPKHVVAKGLNTYYYHNRDKELATFIQKNMVETTGLKDRGIKFGNFHVIRENQKPALLLELGFISDPEEEKMIQQSTYKSNVSKGITKGLIEYFEY